LYWALSDDLKRCGVASGVGEDVTEYTIDTQNLPDGKKGLWHFNALRDIGINLEDWPSRIKAKVHSATLCLGDKALEEVIRGENDSINFQMFTKEAILPLFVVDDDDLIVRLMFRPALTDNERMKVPHKCIEATGLLVKIKAYNQAFFVAGCSDSILSWDGQQSRVVSKHLIERSDTAESGFGDSLSETLRETLRESSGQGQKLSLSRSIGHFGHLGHHSIGQSHSFRGHSDSDSCDSEGPGATRLQNPLARWNAVNDDSSTFEELWAGLQVEQVVHQSQDCQVEHQVEHQVYHQSERQSQYCQVEHHVEHQEGDQIVPDTLMPMSPRPLVTPRE
jgi:hypothetical protein